MSEQRTHNQEFDPKAWEADCRKYDINHEKLGFDVDITFEDGKVRLKLNKLDEKYQRAVKHLMQKNMTGAVYYLNEMFHPWYALPEDEEVEENGTWTTSMPTWNISSAPCSCPGWMPSVRRCPSRRPT